MENVILVDHDDKEIGTMEKMEAHRKEVLHRAFSVLIFNSKGEMLIQKRADEKYHSGGLWTNACCSHPKPGESIEAAAKRRLIEEIGISTNPEPAFSFIYRVELADLVEHELDHVLFATCDENPSINKAEVQDWKFISMDKLKNEINNHPSEFTYWFKLIINHPELSTLIPN